MKTPDITPAQAKADAVLIIGIASALGLKLDGQVSSLLTVAIIAAATLAHLVSYFTDAKLRGSRSSNAVQIAEARAYAVYEAAKANPVATAEQIESIAAKIVQAIDTYGAKDAPGPEPTETS